jgi:hypothetical protein
MALTRSGRLLKAIEDLRAEGRVGDGRVIEMCGGSQEAKELIRLLEAIRFADHDGGVLVATELVHSAPTLEQREKMEGFVLGGEASDYRRLMSALAAPVDCPPPAGHENPPELKKKEVDPETVKRFAKSFLDVSDISSRQKVSK